MIVLVFAVLVAAYVAFFATQNTALVTVHFANLVTPSLPLYAVVIGTMLIGLFIAWIINMLEGFGSAMTIRGKEKNLTTANETINKLQTKLQDLEIENQKLRDEAHTKPVTTHHVEHIEQVEAPQEVTDTRTREESVGYRRPFWENIRHSLR